MNRAVILPFVRKDTARRVSTPSQTTLSST
jgi:hypothetical protein